MTNDTNTTRHPIPRPDILRGILIDPAAGSSVMRLRGVELKADGTELEQMRELLGCRTVDAVTIHDYQDEGFRETLWIDDEGRLSYPNPLGYFDLGGNIYCGRGLILATAPDGESWPTAIHPIELLGVLSFPDTPSEEAVEPRIEVTPLPHPGETTH